MSRAGRFLSRRRRDDEGPGAQVDDGPEAEGGLEPNTAALSEGAPPAGTGGRDQPVGRSPDPRPARGPGEEETGNLPG